jgi:hypothetical protein
LSIMATTRVSSSSSASANTRDMRRNSAPAFGRVLSALSLTRPLPPASPHCARSVQ